jgi:hypothetical protein
MGANSPTRAICCAMCSASLAASVYALGTSAWGRHDPFAEPPVNGRYLRIPLKKSNICVDHSSEDHWQPRWKIP